MDWIATINSLLPAIATLLGGGGVATGAVPVVQRWLTFLADKNSQAALATVEKAIENGIGSAIAARHAADPSQPVTAPLAPTDLDNVVKHVEGLIDLPGKLHALGVDTRLLNPKDLVQAQWGKLLLSQALSVPAAAAAPKPAG